jgi:ribosomal protein L11 methyltransferase
MYLWQKRARSRWLSRYSSCLSKRFGQRLAIIELPKHTRTILEVSCRTRREAQSLSNELGGSIESISRGWRSSGTTISSKPIKIGGRLVIINRDISPGERRGRNRSGFVHGKLPRTLVIPATAAFGTGEHVTTAMCLRLLERKTRTARPGWSLLDCGTGTGILALAAYHFGAERIVAIDSDPLAVSIGKRNAQLNRISGITFQVADVLNWRGRQRFDIITANLYSELLIQALSIFGKKLSSSGQLILSGILREQKRCVIRALHNRGFNVLELRQRGKWIALSAGHAPGRIR